MKNKIQKQVYFLSPSLNVTAVCANLSGDCFFGVRHLFNKIKSTKIRINHPVFREPLVIRNQNSIYGHSSLKGSRRNSFHENRLFRILKSDRIKKKISYLPDVWWKVTSVYDLKNWNSILFPITWWFARRHFSARVDSYVTKKKKKNCSNRNNHKK